MDHNTKTTQTMSTVARPGDSTNVPFELTRDPELESKRAVGHQVCQPCRTKWFSRSWPTVISALKVIMKPWPDGRPAKWRSMMLPLIGTSWHPPWRLPWWTMRTPRRLTASRRPLARRPSGIRRWTKSVQTTRWTLNQIYLRKHGPGIGSSTKDLSRMHHGITKSSGGRTHMYIW